MWLVKFRAFDFYNAQVAMGMCLFMASPRRMSLPKDCGGYSILWWGVTIRTVKDFQYSTVEGYHQCFGGYHQNACIKPSVLRRMSTVGEYHQAVRVTISTVEDTICIAG